MMLSVVWHYWLAVPLAVGSVIAVIATIIGYFKNVTRTQYPD